MAPRRNYNKIPVIDETRLRESFNREDFLRLAKILRINFENLQEVAKFFEIYRTLENLEVNESMLESCCNFDVEPLYFSCTVS